MLKISNFNTIFSSTRKSNNDKSSSYPNLKPLKADTVSFGAMKKSSFDGFDLVCINMLKAPIEKFIDKSDYHSWVNEKFTEKIELKKYQTVNEEDNEERLNILSKWKKYLTEDNDVFKENLPISLIIFHSITKDLGNNRELPPILRPRVLADTMDEISKNLKKDKNYQFNFEKMYRNNLRLSLLSVEKSQKSSTNITKWVKIPSYKNDKRNFSKNVEKLKMLSHDSWCTKSFNAEPYLKKGDFYIYIEKGKPKAAIRMIDDKIEEIQGEKNDGAIPWQYSDIISSFVHKNKLDDQNVAVSIKTAKTKLRNINKIKEYINSGKKPEPKEIFETLDVLEKVNKDGTFTLSGFGNVDEDYSLDNLNLDYNKLLENVSCITGNAFFENNRITSLKNLKSILGNASFENSTIKDLGSLEKIGGTLEIKNSDIKSLGKIKMINDDLSIINSAVEDLGDLMSVKGTLELNNTPIKTLGNLQFVGKDFKISKIPLTSLGKLKTIKGDACFSNTRINDLGDLKSIGQKAVFTNSEIVDLKNLKSIGTIADFRKSKVKNLSKLESVGENVWVDKNSDLDFKNVKVGGRIYV